MHTTSLKISLNHVIMARILTVTVHWWYWPTFVALALSDDPAVIDRRPKTRFTTYVDVRPINEVRRIHIVQRSIWQLATDS